MEPEIFQVDAFTRERFKGNPAAVCLLENPAKDEWMLAVAGEMNLSETAFLQKGADGYHLRWFTPKSEVDLCGHATLAAAHVLWESGKRSRDSQVRFHTRSGVLTAVLNNDWIELDFPAQCLKEREAPEALIRSLGAEILFCGFDGADFLVEVPSELAVRQLTPDFSLLKSIPVRGVMVTSRSNEDHIDFVSRFFAPRLGINEDPVTGSAHCTLGPFWASRLGKKEMMARQLSARGGDIRVAVGKDRVQLAGQAVTVLRGTLV